MATITSSPYDDDQRWDDQPDRFHQPEPSDDGSVREPSWRGCAGSFGPSVDASGPRPTGWDALPGGTRTFLPTGSLACSLRLGQEEPDEARVPRPVL
jgi:hypothetical protein